MELRDMFNQAFYKKLAEAFSKADKEFDQKIFVKEVCSNLPDLSLNQRMRNTSEKLNKFLPYPYKKQLEICMKVIPEIQRGYVTLLFPDFVGLYGKEHVDLSLEALKYFTKFGSSEFAIREFLKIDFKRTIREMEKWAKDKDHHVRRLASEGSRPRLPWSFKLDEVIKNPAATSRILETLKTDSEPYVRKSVANHLNDISKDNPEYMLAMIKSWDHADKHTAWIIKHASRGLIKKGNADSLSVFNFEKDPKINIGNISLGKNKLKLGDTLAFTFEIESAKKKPQKLVVDYIIHYVKKGGEQSPKVFKLKELNLLPGQKVVISKRQVLKDFTTRKHHSGMHRLEIMVNGKVFATTDFSLSVK